MELIHTCYRITDIDRSVAFYEALGFEERGRMPIGDEAINVFMGLPGEDPRSCLVRAGLKAPVSTPTCAHRQAPPVPSRARRRVLPVAGN